MQIILLTNTSQYVYHTTVSHIIQSVLASFSHQVTTLDIDDFTYSHQCLAKITSLAADVIITLDLAGFHLRTQSGENALNMLTSKNLNLIWGNKNEYASYLQKKISLSMLFYDVTGTDNHLPEQYPNMHYYKTLCKLDANENTPEAQTANASAFQTIWNDFTQEVLLSEALH